MNWKIPFVASLLACAPWASAVVFHYDGEVVPTSAPYGTWFTTIGANAFGSFPATSWSSNGSVLTMTTALNSGIYFGRISGTLDPTATIAFAPSLSGNFIETRVALSPSAVDWTFYFYDAGGKGGMFTFSHNELNFWLAPSAGAAAVPNLISLNLTTFHTLSAYLYAGSTYYFVNGIFVGGGHAVTGTGNRLLLGDNTGSTPTGSGSLLVDYFTLTTEVGSESPIAIPEPTTAVAALGGLALAAALVRRRAVRHT